MTQIDKVILDTLTPIITKEGLDATKANLVFALGKDADSWIVVGEQRAKTSNTDTRRGLRVNGIAESDALAYWASDVYAAVRATQRVVVESLKDVDSKPKQPTVVRLEKDTRVDDLRPDVAEIVRLDDVANEDFIRRLTGRGLIHGNRLLTLPEEIIVDSLNSKSGNAFVCFELMNEHFDFTFHEDDLLRELNEFLFTSMGAEFAMRLGAESFFSLGTIKCVKLYTEYRTLKGEM